MLHQTTVPAKTQEQKKLELRRCQCHYLVVQGRHDVTFKQKKKTATKHLMYHFKIAEVKQS